MSATSSFQKVQYVTQPTTPEERNLLGMAGFVHITGLIMSGPGDTAPIIKIGVSTLNTECGCYASNSDKIQIITDGGEIWLATRFGVKTDPPELELARALAMKALTSPIPLASPSDSMRLGSEIGNER